MLTGNPPESAPDRVLSDTLAEPVQLLPYLPPGINKGIMLALCVKASDRPQSIEELKKILSGSSQPDLAVNIKKTEEKSDRREKQAEEKKPAIPIWQAIAIGICLLVLLTIVYGDWGRLEKASSGKQIVPAKQSGNVHPEKTAEIVVDRDTPMVITGPKMGDVWKDPVTGMEFVWVPGGCYQMGCGSWAGDCQSDEKPVHEACVDGFWMGQTEVTQGQWQRVMGSNPSYFKKGDNYPVEQVSWEDAGEYIWKLNGMGNVKFRLPSEAEWEYAARSGGKAEKYSGGNDLDGVAWYDSNSGGSTNPVRTKKSNGLGIYDMSGNVSEWCEDVYMADIYSRSDKNNPIVVCDPPYDSGGSDRVIRGGSWYIVPSYMRCARRNYIVPSGRNYFVGFRLLRMP
jgi:formylglycine-generating enzyme required for sulfatase activity